MPIPVLNQTLTPAEVAGIEAALAALETSLPVPINLTEAERSSLSTVGAERYQLMVRTIEDFAPANPKLQPAFSSLADATTDYTLSQQLRPFIPRLKALVERFEEMEQVALHEIWQYVLDFYSSTQQARLRNVPGSEAIYEEMFPFFDRPSEQPPAPPVP
jgi:hypothetical protein